MDPPSVSCVCFNWSYNGPPIFLPLQSLSVESTAILSQLSVSIFSRWQNALIIPDLRLDDGHFGRNAFFKGAIGNIDKNQWFTFCYTVAEPVPHSSYTMATLMFHIWGCAEYTTCKIYELEVSDTRSMDNENKARYTLFRNFVTDQSQHRYPLF